MNWAEPVCLSALDPGTEKEKRKNDSAYMSIEYYIVYA